MEISLREELVKLVWRSGVDGFCGFDIEPFNDLSISCTDAHLIPLTDQIEARENSVYITEDLEIGNVKDLSRKGIHILKLRLEEVKEKLVLRRKLEKELKHTTNNKKFKI